MKSKKLIIILTVLLLFLVSGLTLYLEHKSDNPTHSYLECINKTVLPENYTKGEVLIGIKQETSEKEINSFNERFDLKENITMKDYYYEIRHQYDIFNFPVYQRDNKSWEAGGKPAKDFVNYLNSSPALVKSISFDYNMVNSLIIVFFYKNVSFEESENLIKNYQNFKDFDSLDIRDRVSFGKIKVLEETEIEWICKFKEEKIVKDAFVMTLPSTPE